MKEEAEGATDAGVGTLGAAVKAMRSKRDSKGAGTEPDEEDNDKGGGGGGRTLDRDGRRERVVLGEASAA